MNDIAQKLALRYGGTVAQPEEYDRYLYEGQEILFVIKFDDPKANYLLLSEYDLQSLSEATRRASISTQTSPFNKLKLIVYRDDRGEVNFKLLHGMASRLVEEMYAFCNKAEFYQRFLNLLKIKLYKFKGE